MFIDSLPMFYICSKNVLIRAGMIAACEYQWPANLPVLLDFPFVGYLREEARYNDFFNTNGRRKLNDLKSRVWLLFVMASHVHVTTSRIKKMLCQQGFLPE